MYILENSIYIKRFNFVDQNLEPPTTPVTISYKTNRTFLKIYKL